MSMLIPPSCFSMGARVEEDRREVEVEGEEGGTCI
jgi:hypothetical protein